MQMVTRIVRNGYPLPRAVTIRAYRTGIPAWYDCPISTVKVEGINNKIRVMKRVVYGFRNERYFRLRLYALHDCRITPNVGWTFFCVRDVLLVMFSNLYNAGAARGLHARVYARVRRFLFLAFTSSPVCHKLLSLSV